MPFTEEQSKSIKQQILKQIESFPEDKREQIKSYVHSLNNEQLEEFLIKNNLIKSSENPEKTDGCIFCSIANKKIESLNVYEDKDYLAALEINPYSIGHAILIPKKHIKESKGLPSKAFTIANKIGRHLIKKLKAESFQITSSEDLKHAIVNIIPVYKDKPLDYQRKPMKKQELQDVAIKIGEIKKKEKKEKIVKTNKKLEKEIAKDLILLNRRIP